MKRPPRNMKPKISIEQTLAAVVSSSNVGIIATQYEDDDSGSSTGSDTAPLKVINPEKVTHPLVASTKSGGNSNSNSNQIGLTLPSPPLKSVSSFGSLTSHNSSTTVNKREKSSNSPTNREEYVIEVSQILSQMASRGSSVGGSTAISGGSSLAGSLGSSNDDLSQLDEGWSPGSSKPKSAETSTGKLSSSKQISTKK